ncbi:MAG: phage terminase large subunit [Myxococcales bacterium]|nr:phage terminase large subunit [Myxococcales bacterium]
MKARRIASLERFIPLLSPRYVAPTHLRPFLEVLERALVEPVRAVVSVPPRHAKTESVLHAIPWWLLQRPDAQIAYVSYAQRLAEKKSRKARELAIAAHVTVSEDSASKHDWRTGVEDGGVWATSIGGGITGEGFDVLLVDDPVKDRVEAESSLRRQQTREWFDDVAFTRLEPNGSAIVIQTRWHPDDLAGSLIRDGWANVCLPAIDGHGRALWPERFSVERLRAIQEQIGAYGWASLYQGQPMPRGGALFQDVHVFDAAPPRDGLDVRIGVDLAYSTKTRADYSVAVVLGTTGRGRDSLHFVLEVLRLQVRAPEFMGALKGLRDRWGGARATAFVSGTEKGTVDMMRSQGLSIDARPAIGDKFTRAQPVAAKWNAGRVLLPNSAPWLDAFVSEIVSFTGAGDVHDDQVDALAGAFAASPGAFASSPLRMTGIGQAFSQSLRGAHDKWGPLLAIDDASDDDRDHSLRFVDGEGGTNGGDRSL